MSSASLLSEAKSSQTSIQTKVEEDLQESWVELAPPSRGSGSSITTCTDTGVILERLLIDAQQSLQSLQSVPSSAKDSRRHSPKSLQSPHVEFETGFETIKYRLTTRDTDWIWDWSSRPEALPPKEWRSRRPNSRGSLTTPPNSPVPSQDGGHFLSLRHSKWMRSRLVSSEVMWGFVLSNFVTFLLGTCIGFYVARKCGDASAAA